MRARIPLKEKFENRMTHKCRQRDALPMRKGMKRGKNNVLIFGYYLLSILKNIHCFFFGNNAVFLPSVS